MEDLKAGERLHVAGGAVEAVVTTLRLEQAPAGGTFTTFNLEVAGWHTYFVAPKASPPGTAAVWVHNMCDARLQELLIKIANNDPRYGERVLASIRGGLKDENQLRRIEAAVDARRLAAPENLASAVPENALVSRIRGKLDLYPQVIDPRTSSTYRYRATLGDGFPLVNVCRGV